MLHRTRSAVALQLRANDRHGPDNASRKRIERAFGWIKTVAAREDGLRSRDRVDGIYVGGHPGAADQADGEDQLMVKGPCYAAAFVDRWHAVEMNVWDIDFFDHVEEADLTFPGQIRWRNPLWGCQGGSGRALRHPPRTARAQFSWEQHDEDDPRCDGGWAMTGTAGKSRGHFYIHSRNN